MNLIKDILICAFATWLIFLVMIAMAAISVMAFQVAKQIYYHHCVLCG